MLALEINILLTRVLFISQLLQSCAIVKAQKILTDRFKKPTQLALKQFYYKNMDFKTSGNTVKVTT